MKTNNLKELYLAPEIDAMDFFEAGIICTSTESGFNIDDTQEGYDL